MQHKNMISVRISTLFLSKQKIAIPSKFDKLIPSLKTAYTSTGNFDLDKEISVNSHHIDALRLLLKGVKFRTSE